MTAEFSEFVREKSTKKSKVESMTELLPKFEIGIKNGHGISDMCRALSESEGPFLGVSLDSIKSVYYHAKKKADKTASKNRGAT